MTAPGGYGDFAWYRGDLPWLQIDTIFLTRHGSQAYGTNVEGSDTDLKGVAIPPLRYFLGDLHRFEQAEVHDPVDATIFDIRKFFRLAAACNPNVVELLYTSPEDHYVVDPAWEYVVKHRADFLSRRALHTFSGYAHAQLKRIRTHRRWLLEPPAGQPRRADFGLSDVRALDRDRLAAVEAQVRKLEDGLGGEGLTKDQVEERDVELVTRATADLELPPGLIEAIVRERRYNAACRNWTQFQTWKTERNPARAALEAKFGYDTKNGMHLVRLLRMAGEILTLGEVLVRRPDADELREVRAGVWSFDRLLAWAEEEEVTVRAAAEVSPLPREPDREFLDRLLVQVVQFHHGL